jgi:parallel beta-helix repeat protein
VATVVTLVVSTIGVALITAASSAAAAGDLIADSFNRSTTNGWASAEAGGAYTYSEPTAFGVSGGRGTIKLPAAGQSRQANLSLPAAKADQVATASLGVQALPTAGNGVYLAVLTRNGGGKAYRAVATVQPSGTTTLAVSRIDGSASKLTSIGSTVTLPNKLSAGSLLKIELSVSGTTTVAISARVWPATGTPPTTPQIRATDSTTGRVASGGFGIWAYTSSSSGAATVLVDDVSVRPPAGSAPTTTPAPNTTAAPSPTSVSPTSTTTVAPTTPPATPVVGAPIRPDSARYGPVPWPGSRSFPAPAGNARYVSPTGSDSAAGTLAAPFRTITKAISVAAAGDTVVLRAGTYHESLTVGKRLTIQPYNNEIVWLDGSSVVSGWVSDGAAWRVDNWTAEFDASPTYTRGAADSTEEFWGFVNKDYPMAAHPDQVWIDNLAQVQVGSLAEVGPGEFYVDYATNRLYLGSNPAGRTVRASDLSKAISVRADGSVLQGFGVSRFAPSVPDMGAVTMEKPNGRVIGMAFVDNSTTGLSLLSSGLTVTDLTSARNGMLGVHANYADNLTASGVNALGNNTEHFNSSPVSGGFKITRTRGIAVNDGQFRDNDGPGLWLDESTYNSKIVGNKLMNNGSHGVSVELSSTSTLVNNLLVGNSGFGMKVNDTSSVRIWNNTLLNNNRPINIVQDARRASDQSAPGHDPRQPFPDPTMTWINGPVEVRNNIMAGTIGNCLLCVEDYSKQLTAEQMNVTALGNVYQRPSTSAPAWVAVWSTGSGNPKVFTTLAAFKSGTGQESVSLALDGKAATNANGSPSTDVQNAVSSVAQTLPPELGSTPLPAGSKRLGSTLTS